MELETKVGDKLKMMVIGLKKIMFETQMSPTVTNISSLSPIYLAKLYCKKSNFISTVEAGPLT